MSDARLELDLADFTDAFKIRSYGARKAKRGPRGALVVKPAKQKQASGPAVREKIARTMRKVPEVMVKITQGRKDPETGVREVLCKDMRGIRAHMEYISRNGGVELEDENGHLHTGRKDVDDVLDGWEKSGIPIPKEGGRRREAYSIILSMPPGTDRASVKAAARAFASAEFPTHQYVFAAHDDEAHPHVHLTVKTADRNGLRLTPRKADLQRWRELFAEKLREQGIEANATPRQLRGVVRKAEHHIVRSIKDRGGESKAYKGQLRDAETEARGGEAHINPAKEKIAARRQKVVRDYGLIAKALVAGDADDKALAVKIVDFVKAMPPPLTAHELLVRQYQRSAGGASRVPHGTERDRDRS